MDLNGLKFLAAASLLSGSVRAKLAGKSDRWTASEPLDVEIQAAVKVAGRIWDEVVEQDPD
jgi:hypothetical protein